MTGNELSTVFLSICNFGSFKLANSMYKMETMISYPIGILNREKRRKETPGTCKLHIIYLT